MSWSITIGRIAGTAVRIHITFLLLLAWIGLSAWRTGGSEAALGGLVFILLLFGCVLAHEFGHILMARRFGIATPEVTLLPIGGVAALERMPEKPREQLAVAVAGPAVTVAIAAVLLLYLFFRTRLGTEGSPSRQTTKVATLGAARRAPVASRTTSAASFRSRSS